MTDQREKGIAWTEETWNPLRGCSIVGPECLNCYAMATAHRYGDPGMAYEGLTKLVRGKPVWKGIIEVIDHKMTEPIRWQRPRRIFVNSMSDILHERLPFDVVARIFGIMALAPHHTFQVLTKRAGRLVEFFNWIESQPRHALALCIAEALVAHPEIATPRTNEIIKHGLTWPLKNVWVGVSVGMKATKDRIDHLRKVPASVRWLSIEPQIEDLGTLDLGGIHWVVQGGEAAPRNVCREFNASWVADVMGQARAQGVAYFFKQTGSKPLGFGTITQYKGDDQREWPEAFRVREYPVTPTWDPWQR